MSDVSGIILNQGEGESYWVLGDYYTFKATGKQTNGEYTLVEEIIQPQNGPPLHLHHHEDETFYILEGQFHFVCGDREQVLGPGAFLYAPKGTRHTFKNIAGEPGRMLCFITPAGLEEFFYAIGTPAAGTDSAPAYSPDVMDKILQLADDYELEIFAPEEE